MKISKEELADIITNAVFEGLKKFNEYAAEEPEEKTEQYYTDEEQEIIDNALTAFQTNKPDSPISAYMFLSQVFSNNDNLVEPFLNYLQNNIEGLNITYKYDDGNINISEFRWNK